MTDRNEPDFPGWDGVDRRTFLGGVAMVGASAAAMPLCARDANGPGAQRDQLFDADWAFHLGDVPGAEQVGFDDRAWRRLDLPHDWSIEDIAGHPAQAEQWIAPVATWSPTARGELKPDEYMVMPSVPEPGTTDVPLQVGPFDPSVSAGGAGTGWVVGGTGCYRKHFSASPVAGRQMELRFDGAFQQAEVWINGVLLGKNVNGYTGFAFDLTPHLRESENLIAVRVRNEGPTSRWYSGSGLYRHVWLTTTGAIRLPMWGVTVTTPMVATERATVIVTGDIENRTGAPIAATLRISLIDASGRSVAHGRTKTAVAPGSFGQARCSIGLAVPDLWSPDASPLYTAQLTLIVAGQIVDRTTTRFGVRAIEIDAEAGLRVNGKPFKLRGACIHHDNGLIGARAIDRADIRKVELMKAQGFNAIRCAHNPPSPAFLDACDELGMLVIDEAFDVWEEHKVAADYASFFREHWRDDLAATIRRDRNHPSVILWSLGNEIRDKPGPRRSEIGRMLRDEARRLDPTRGVIIALNEVFGPINEVAMRDVDVVGLNYRVSNYEHDHLVVPAKALIGTEVYSKQLLEGWREVERHSWLLGEFVWTGIDYLGETGLGSSQLRARGDKRPAQKLPFTTFYWDYPAFMSGCGDLDIIGNKKAKSHYRDVLWGRSPVELLVQRPLPAGMVEEVDDWGWRDEMPSWTWNDALGTPLAVRAYSNGDEVRLLLDGREVGRKTIGLADRLTAEFEIPYRPGVLEAISISRGAELGRATLTSAGPAAGLRILLERARIDRGGRDLAYAAVEVIDSNGRLVADTTVSLKFELSGCAKLLAVGSANPRGVESFADGRCQTFHGRALAIVSPTGQGGIAALLVQSDGLRPATAMIKIV